MPTMMLWPNVDAGSEDIATGMRRSARRVGRAYIRFYKNFPDRDLPRSDALVLAASSATRARRFARVRSLGVPAVNIGTRRWGATAGRTSSTSAPPPRDRPGHQTQHAPPEKKRTASTGSSLRRRARLATDRDHPRPHAAARTESDGVTATCMRSADVAFVRFDHRGRVTRPIAASRTRAGDHRLDFRPRVLVARSIAGDRSRGDGCRRGITPSRERQRERTQRTHAFPPVGEIRRHVSEAEEGRIRSRRIWPPNPGAHLVLITARKAAAMGTRLRSYSSPPAPL
jgi:hypothetical protein